jgi:protein-disulfide isomerase
VKLIRWSILSVLAFLGMVISFYQTHRFFEVRSGLTAFESFCNIGGTFDCSVIENSRFAELLPGIPLSAFAAGWFTCLLIVSFLGRDRNWNVEAKRMALGLTAVGTLVSIVYFIIMASVLNTFCILCLGIDAINIVALGLVLSMGFATLKNNPFSPRQWKTGLIILTGSMLLGIGSSAFFAPKGISAGDQQVLLDRVLRRPPVNIRIPESAPTVGPEDAPITIVKFSDFRCPHCQRGAYALHPVLQRYSDRIRYVFMNFPLDGACNSALEQVANSGSCEAAKATLCAEQRGEFRKVYQKLFDHQSQLSSSSARRFASIALGINETELQTCFDSSETATALRESTEEAVRLGVTSTPAFYINGHRVDGAYPTEVWEKLIQRFSKASE